MCLSHKDTIIFGHFSVRKRYNSGILVKPNLVNLVFSRSTVTNLFFVKQQNGR